MRSLVAAALIVPALAAPASAGDWRFTVSPYLWLPGLDTSVSTPRGDFDLSMTASEVLSDFDAGFMGYVEARNGPWALALDFIYSDLSDSRELSGNWSRVSASNQLTALTLYGEYRAVDTGLTSLDLMAGARYYDLDFRLSLAPGKAPGFSQPVGESWTDPVAGLRLRHAFSERWFSTLVADVGGFSGDSSSWQVFGSVGYRIGEAWSVQGGWRHMSISRDLGTTDLDIDLSGPVFGASYSF